ncbi:hypothetical protein M427DRAFT_35915 [Gonapodya prolifera JEL478]|uniref:PPP4R2-domain-containing protein n=1 Tax=Gonapodya prolifera (strain JEL478) TaxID=1344416 RepID=A0A139A3K8_GONPJ|nr:hypothetical protein M427DRAFT_35915 [Gonapodya prolifera JEL478]|eukprot:KXS11382.1 hypothetical protein M427DRAFT_35915 [Gonapodya prolifera JEL478]
MRLTFSHVFRYGARHGPFLRVPWTLARDAIRQKLEAIIHDFRDPVTPIPNPIDSNKPVPANPDASPIPPPPITPTHPPPAHSDAVNASVTSVQNAAIGPHGETVGEYETRLLDALDYFDDRPPFTIQRLCELLTIHRKQYNFSRWKYLAALEKVLSVTSAFEDPPGPPGGVSVESDLDDHGLNRSSVEREISLHRDDLEAKDHSVELEGWDGPLDPTTRVPPFDPTARTTSAPSSRLDWSTVADGDDEPGPSMEELLDMDSSPASDQDHERNGMMVGTETTTGSSREEEEKMDLS